MSSLLPTYSKNNLPYNVVSISIVDSLFVWLSRSRAIVVSVLRPISDAILLSRNLERISKTNPHLFHLDIAYLSNELYTNMFQDGTTKRQKAPELPELCILQFNFLTQNLKFT